MVRADDPAVVGLRSFNRSFTQRIGVLDHSFLGTGRSVGTARLLFEIGVGGTTVRHLRAALGLDSGYLSRLLRELESDGLVTVQPDDDDRRRRVVQLTPEGVAEWHELDARSDALAIDLLSALGDRQRQELVDALGTADRLLRAATVEHRVVDPQSSDAINAMHRYFDELATRFRDGFEPGDTLVADAPAMRAPDGAFVVARSDSDVIGCGGVQRHDDHTAEIKRMWISGDWRGLGMGRRLLDRLEQTAQDLGYTRIVLDTNEVLTEAVAMYERAGYSPTARYNDNPYAHHWFTKPLR